MAKYYVVLNATNTDYERDSECLHSFEEAIQLLYKWVEADKAEPIEEEYDSLEYRIYRNLKVVAMYDCWDKFHPTTYIYIDEDGEQFVVPYGDLTLNNARPRFSHGGKREGAGRKPNTIPKKNINLRVTEEEAIKIKEYLAQLRKEK